MIKIIIEIILILFLIFMILLIPIMWSAYIYELRKQEKEMLETYLGMYENDIKRIKEI